MAFFAEKASYNIQHGKRPLTMEDTSLMLLALPQALYHSSVCSSIWDGFIARDISSLKFSSSYSFSAIKGHATGRSNQLHIGLWGSAKNKSGESFLIRTGLLWDRKAFSLPSVLSLLRKWMRKLWGPISHAKLHPDSTRSVQMMHIYIWCIYIPETVNLWFLLSPKEIFCRCVDSYICVSTPWFTELQLI